MYINLLLKYLSLGYTIFSHVIWLGMLKDSYEHILQVISSIQPVCFNKTLSSSKKKKKDPIALYTKNHFLHLTFYHQFI